MKGTLATLLSIALLFWSCHGKETNQKYHFKGKIGDENVKFSEYYFLGKKTNHLIKNIWLKDSYSRHVNYMDDDDLKVDFVMGFECGRGKDTTFAYRSGEVDDRVMQEAQRQFDSYLEKIHETKTAEALENLGDEIR
ncbi:hypothetical protein A3K73_00785 [Candidatus Pacearchaeota archaeon RBG_13_36_9]|nr:MAG: hypothetical protein A3K73_00785 [Candidatus Pacearchaeota archaeon RBG_13_36_9]